MSWFIIERVHERWTDSEDDREYDNMWAGPPFETEEEALQVLNNSQNRNARVEQILPKKNVCLCRTAETIEDFDERWDFLDKNEDYLLPCCEKLLEEIRDEGLEKAEREGWLAYHYEEIISKLHVGNVTLRELGTTGADGEGEEVVGREQSRFF